VKNTGRHLTFVGNVRVPRYARDLQLVTKKKMQRYIPTAYALSGKARLKWAYLAELLNSPDEIPYRPGQDLIPSTLKDHIKLCREGVEVPTTKEELVALMPQRKNRFSWEETHAWGFPGEE
jgi:hypothetical protein